MKVIFLGTPDFGVPALEQIVKKHQVLACVCQPDKVGARGKTEFCAIKKFALANNIPVYQFEKISRDGVETLKNLAPDIMVTAAYGQILSQEIIDIAPHGIINIHGSLLPEYRGAAPMQRAIIDGKDVTGITTMYMDVGLDTGDMLLREEVKILDSDNFETIHDKLGECGATLIVRTLSAIAEGKAERIPQDGSLATYAAKITKADCELSFDRSAKEVHDLIRGLSPFPLSFTHTPDGRLLKITSSFVSDRDTPHDEVGKIISLDGGITVACKEGAVTFTGVLPEGKSRMAAADFIRGRKVNIGDILK